ncbi:hypothetical protein [Ekhidna sp.]|uniref:hypothetical protein n=1 Tax=Ekhidna sp. TaxID=2608089 RepID=UPI003B5CA47B
MKRLALSSLLIVLCSHAYSQDSTAWEIRADVLAPLTNNLTFGIERKFDGFGIQVDYGFPVQMIRYDGNILLADQPEGDKYDEGHFFKATYKNYTLLKHSRRYALFQISRASYGNNEDWFTAYGIFVGVGERLNWNKVVLDYYVSLGLGDSSGESRNYHFGFASQATGNPMISLGVALAFPIRKKSL